MIEIFSTNIKNVKEANIISGLIHLCFPNIHANFDLYDIEPILRVEFKVGSVDVKTLMSYVTSLGYDIKPIA